MSAEEAWALSGPGGGLGCWKVPVASGNSVPTPPALLEPNYSSRWLRLRVQGGCESHHAGGTGIFWGVIGEGSFHTPGSEGDLLSVQLPPGVLFAWKQDTQRGPQTLPGHTLAQVHPALGVEQCLSWALGTVGWARPEADWLLHPPASLCPPPLSSPCPLHAPWTLPFPLGQSIPC